MLRPLAATRLNRPSRSTNITVACGTIFIVFAAITSSTMPIKNRKKIKRKAGRTASFCRMNRLANDIVNLRGLSPCKRANYNETTDFRQLESDCLFDNCSGSEDLRFMRRSADNLDPYRQPFGIARHGNGQRWQAKHIDRLRITTGSKDADRFSPNGNARRTVLEGSSSADGRDD